MTTADQEKTSPSPFEMNIRNPETAQAVQTFLSATISAPLEGETPEDAAWRSTRWRGLMVQVEDLGLEHGTEVLKLLSDPQVRGNLSPFYVDGAIQIYCSIHKVSVPEVRPQFRQV